MIFPKRLQRYGMRIRPSEPALVHASAHIGRWDRCRHCTSGGGAEGNTFLFVSRSEQRQWGWGDGDDGVGTVATPTRFPTKSVTGKTHFKMRSGLRSSSSVCWLLFSDLPSFFARPPPP